MAKRDQTVPDVIPLQPTILPISLPCENLLEYGLPIYRALLTRFPEEQIVLLESLGRHSVDARSTLIGLNPVLSLEVRGTEVCIQGAPSLLPPVEAALRGHDGGMTAIGRLEYVLPERSAIWDFLRQFESAFAVQQSDGAAPLALFGYLGYDTIRYIETVQQHHLPLDDTPEMALTLYSTLITLDDLTATLTHYQFPGDDDIDLTEIVRLCESGPVLPPVEDPGMQPYVLERETTCDSYLQKCERALEHIRIGDIYQIQVGQKLRVQSSLSPLALYIRLRKLNPSPYMYLFSAAGRTIVGASPELFIRTESERVVMRPIAGTVGKAGGRTLEEAKAALRDSEKEVAEHLMLVDLCRNDICRICSPESLAVENLMDIEEYSHVFHMVSSVSGWLRRDYDKYDAIRASFPAGTMTGTPKIRAIELIEEIEDSARGLYAGIIGLIGIGRNYINTALCIRSAVFEQGGYTLRASAGIVADSHPASEYRETLQKLGGMFQAITGEELT
ncbi:MAG TPA: anthranilate synthase component I family protein [Dongiaceae bacterium]|nr:anthranilate synthase component I family protein [Dongiaceae bacterium]